MTDAFTHSATVRYVMWDPLPGIHTREPSGIAGAAPPRRAGLR
jgi:hypothetical protein